MRLHTPLKSFSPVASGQVAQCKISKDRRIHAIFLKLASETATQMGYKIREIRLMLGTVQLIRLSPAQLVALNAYRALTYTNGWLELYFSDPTVRTPVGEESTALNTFGLGGELILEVEFKTDAEYNAATSTSDGFTPVLEGLMEYDYVNDGNRAFVTRKPITIINAATGEFDFQTLPRVGAYKALHLFTSYIDRVRVYRDDVELLDRTSAQITILSKRNGLTPQSGHLPIDFQFTNQATDAAEMIVQVGVDAAGKPVFAQAKSFDFKFTANTGGNITAVVEQIVTV